MDKHKYECKHQTDGIIAVDDNPESINSFLIWADSVGVNGTKEMYFDCYCSQKVKEKNNA